MAFNDNPIVDDKSERSEESVLNARQIFTRKNGFISREENPDYGVDLDVELVVEQGATSSKFPIQIKSTHEIDLIDVNGIRLISLPFKTSRLGYLCRRVPAYGIVVIYDEATGNSYFDYAEDIVARIIRERGNDDWKNQESVNIHIPLQLLNSITASEIHSVVMQRFRNHDRMIGAYGSLYKIPNFKKAEIDEDIDFNNIEQVETLLKKSGVGLFNAKEYSMLVDLLSKLSISKIANSKDLLFVSIITYGQIGMIIECDYSLERSKKFWDEYTDDEKLVIEYQALMVAFRKGKLSQSDFEGGLNRLKGRAKSTLNSLTLDINLVYVKFLTAVNEGKVDGSTLDLIRSISSKVDESDLAQHEKFLLTLFNLENLHNYGTDLLLKDGSKFILQEKLGIHVPVSIRLKRARGVLSIIEVANEQVVTIYRQAKEQGDKVVNAHAAYYKARFFFSTNFHTMLLSANQPRYSNETTKNLYSAHVRICYESIGLFFDLNMLHDAHQALTCAYDIQSLYETLYGEKLEDLKSLSDIESTIRKVEKETGISAFRSIVREAFLGMQTPSNEKFSEMTPEKIDLFAEQLLRAYEIPAERKVNIVAEINGQAIFEKECENEDIELLLDLTHLQSKSTAYVSSPKFILRSKVTGIESKRSENIYEVLEQFSGLLKKKN